jgi:hypothetical protein
MPQGLTLPETIDLFDAPELAVLCTLEAALHGSICALAVANPELLGDGPRVEGSHPPQVWIADTLVDHARTMLVSLQRYRAMVRLAAAHHGPLDRDDSEISF